MRTAELVARTRAISTAVIQLLWQQWDAPGAWDGKLDVAAAIVTKGQVQAAKVAQDYTLSNLGAADFDLDPEAFGGLASDGRPLKTLMQSASIIANRAYTDGEYRTAEVMIEQAKKGNTIAKNWLGLVGQQQTSDSQRAAIRAAMAIHNKGGVRVASPPCCGRCAVLNGRHYTWNAEFRRHPNCDCTVSLDGIAPDLSLDDVKGLSRADREAVEMGADLNGIVNSHRAMYTTEIDGVKVKATFDSTAHRDAAFYTKRGAHQGDVRLRPETILRQASSREEALQGLEYFGYIR